ncbi:hypothetical protein [Streptomyces fuscichromogenes]|uniref:Uncharacterized protein n=1 Tax=Streptomyces fuscichromogenes TaxID=1324013 RepID=A0A917XQP8_9ACTN|nr:hypothetical protein [Streptomyces fuscichromogenes]GGN47240.1 hypothetical protein GCM10011578_100730 [Streptomyces fuscichromogenes]
MTAIEEQPAGTAQEGIPDSSALTVDDATRATQPHLPYADAVHAALAEIELLPDLVEVGTRREGMHSGRLQPPELVARLEWLPGHDDLATLAVQVEGLVVEWSHLGGWVIRSGSDLVVLDVDDLADPATVAEAAMHAALCGLRCSCEQPLPGRWKHAVYLDIALVAYDEREGARDDT